MFGLAQLAMLAAPKCESCGAPATQMVRDVVDVGATKQFPHPQRIGLGWTHLCDACATGNDPVALIGPPFNLHGSFGDLE